MRFWEHLFRMKRAAFTFVLTYTAVSLCLAAPAPAQLYLENYRTDKPGVELDMDVLNDLPPRGAAPALRPPQDFSETSDAPPAVPAPHVEPAPRPLRQPLFAAPIPTPVPPQKQPAPLAAPAAPPPAARQPYNPYLTAPMPAAPAVRAPRSIPARIPSTLLPPLEEADEDTASPRLPHRKPAATPPAAAPPAQGQDKPVLSYPPAAMQKAPVQHYARPVLPKNSTLEMPQISPPSAASEPVTATGPAVAKPLPKPPIETLPEEIISETEMGSLPADTALPPTRKPAAAENANAEIPPVSPSAADTTAAIETAAQVEVPLPSPKPFVRPSLIVTDKKPPVLPRAVLKQAEVTMPISTTEYAQIAENMEAVPVEVAMAPPKPVYAPKAASAADMTLEFDRASESLSPAAHDKLQSVIAQMNADDSAKLQVRAYATGDDGSKAAARSKSLTRATEVRSFLMDNGIKPTRIIVRAMGQETDRKPLDRIDLIFLKQE